MRVPRDWKGAFVPQVIGKGQTKTEGLEEAIIATSTSRTYVLIIPVYAKGMSNRDIEDHLRDIYGVEASASLISRITDKVLPQMQEWQSRPLEGIYPVVFMRLPWPYTSWVL